MNDNPINFEQDVASAHECTGLIPALPLNDSYADDEMTDLYAVLPPKKRNGRRIEGNDRRKPK